MFGKLKEKFFGGSAETAVAVAAPVTGSIVPLSEVADPTFAEGILGQGAAIIPTEGRIVAPADAVVDVMFDTGHAVSLTTKDGAEVLIHVGLDTVRLAGKHYTAHCKAGDSVRKGDLLIEFDLEGIRAEGYDIVTPVIICNTDAYSSVVAAEPGAVTALDALLTLQK